MCFVHCYVGLLQETFWVSELGTEPNLQGICIASGGASGQLSFALQLTLLQLTPAMPNVEENILHWNAHGSSAFFQPCFHAKPSYMASQSLANHHATIRTSSPRNCADSAVSRCDCDHRVSTDAGSVDLLSFTFQPRKEVNNNNNTTRTP